MNVSFEKVDNVNALLTVQIEKADYENKVVAALKDLRKKAQIPGFRAGMVPTSLLKKRFGEEVLAEQVNKILGEAIYGYIREQELNILGEPLPNEEKQPTLDFATQEEFTFVFDVALAPEFDATLTASDTLPFYEIEVTDEMVENQVKQYAQRGGQYNKVEEYQEGDMVKGHLAQLTEDGSLLEGGIQVEDAVMLPNYMKNEDEKAKFVGAKVNDVLTFNPAIAYENNAVELSSLLKISKEEAAEMKSDFSFQIAEITRYEAAAINQELFDNILGDGVVSSEDEFRATIKKQMQGQFVDDSEFKLLNDLREYLTNRIGELAYPEAFLKRLMLANNRDKGEEYVEKNFAASLKELTWHLIKEQIAKKFELKIESEDLLSTAKMLTRLQFAQYGMMNVPEDIMEQYAKELLKNKDQSENIMLRAFENKILAKAKEVITLQNKTISLEDFNKMFETSEAE